MTEAIKSRERKTTYHLYSFVFCRISKWSLSIPELSVLKELCSECGSGLVELALVLPVLSILFLGVADFGQAYYMAIEVSHAAHSAALYGSQNPIDIAGMKSAAVADAPDVPNFSTSSVTVSHGCECSDGSSPVPSCTTAPTCLTNVVNYIKVDTSVPYTLFFPAKGIPASITLTGSAKMRAGQ